MLDTASIIRHLDAKVRQHMQGDSGGETRRSVSMLLTLLGGQEADSVNSLAIGARAQDGASVNAGAGAGAGASPGAGAGAGSGSPDARLRTPDVEGLDEANVKRIGRGSTGMHGQPHPQRPLNDPSTTPQRHLNDTSPTPSSGMGSGQGFVPGSRGGGASGGGSAARGRPGSYGKPARGGSQDSVTSGNSAASANELSVDGGAERGAERPPCACKLVQASPSRKRPRPILPQQRGEVLMVNAPAFLESISRDNVLSATTAQAIMMSEHASDGKRIHLAYEGSSAAGKGLSSRVPTPVPYMVPPQGYGEPFTHSLTFDACFESGNLLRAVQRGPAEYDLFLRADLHTEGHMQWFFFSVANTHPPGSGPVDHAKVKFNIVNLTKPDSLFNHGLQPVMYVWVAYHYQSTSHHYQLPTHYSRHYPTPPLHRSNDRQVLDQRRRPGGRGLDTLGLGDRLLREPVPASREWAGRSDERRGEQLVLHAHVYGYVPPAGRHGAARPLVPIHVR